MNMPARPFSPEPRCRRPSAILAAAFLVALAAAAPAAAGSEGQRSHANAPFFFNTSRLKIITVISRHTPRAALRSLAGSEDAKIAAASKLMLSLLERRVEHGTAAKITKLAYISTINNPGNALASRALLNTVTDPSTPENILKALEQHAPTNVREAAGLMLSFHRANIAPATAARTVALLDDVMYGGRMGESESMREILSLLTDPSTDERLLRLLAKRPCAVQPDAQRMLALRNRNVNGPLSSKVVRLLHSSMTSRARGEYARTIGELIDIIENPATPFAVLAVIRESDTYRVRPLALRAIDKRAERQKIVFLPF